MSDPNPAATAAQFRSLLRSFVLDPGPALRPACSTAEHLARPSPRKSARPATGSSPPWSPSPPSSARSSATTTPAAPPSPGSSPGAPPAGCPPCSPDTGGYCKARQRLPETLLPRLVRDTADRPPGQRPRGLAVPRPPRGPRRRLDGQHARHPREPGRVPPAQQPEAGLRVPDRPDRRPDLPWPPGACSTRPIGAGKGKLTGEMRLDPHPARAAEAGRHPAGRQLLQLVRRGGDAGGGWGSTW